MKAPLILFLIAFPSLAPAQDAPAAVGPALTAEAFEALVEGKTMDTHGSDGVYGVETFLPGRRAIWRDPEQCLEGRWRPEGELICFDYIGEPLPYCWTYHEQGDRILGFYNGDQSDAPIALYPSQDFVTCDGFIGA